MTEESNERVSAPWIKWVIGLARKREVIAIAAKLNTHRLMVAAALMEVWEWADANTADGHVPNVTTVTLESACCPLPGLIDAMADKAIGWLISDEDGTGLIFPNYIRHNGKSAKKRALNTEAKRRSRSGVISRSCNNHDTSHTPRMTKARREKRREEKKIKTPSIPQGGGEGVVDPRTEHILELAKGPQPCKPTNSAA
jgi:DNA replication protein DnaT